MAHRAGAGNSGAGGRDLNFTFLRYDTLGSTNVEAAEQARKGAAEGLCVIAREQTAGRGRHGRAWISERDAGLYFSIVLRPVIEARSLSLITLMSGIATCDALAETGLAPDIKWVNDILVNEKKISGILAETVDTANGMAVIVGIGVNLRSSNYPPDVSARATSIEAEGGQMLSADELAAMITRWMGHFYRVLCSEHGPRRIIDEWRRRSSYFSGKRVRVVLPNETIEGITDGLEETGALRLRRIDGSIAIIQAGEVETVRAQWPPQVYAN